jgi:hypothetical protein
MATSPWDEYNSLKANIGRGDIKFATDEFKMALFGSASNANDLTLSALASVTSEVTQQFGYLTGGQTLLGVTWTSGASAKEWRFDETISGRYWSANGGSIGSVKYAVIYDNTHASNLLVCFSELTTVEFDVSDTNSLTVAPTTNGYLELN